ncbi:MAG: hypothetical protein L0387_30795 [Acidobacteria bacterium]|nr:hypothetical protein [Acidobacteriota bacterium]
MQDTRTNVVVVVLTLATALACQPPGRAQEPERISAMVLSRDSVGGIRSQDTGTDSSSPLVTRALLGRLTALRFRRRGTNKDQRGEETHFIPGA